MTKKFPILQLALVLGLGLATSACETVSSAADDAANGVGNVISNLNPFGDDSDAPPPVTADGTDSAAPDAGSDVAANVTPDLAHIPARPVTTTPGQQQAAAQSLAADGAQARYSADALRAGTEAAAAPPAAADLPPPSAQVALAAPPSANDDQAPSAAAAPSAQPASQALLQGTAAVPAAGTAPRTGQTTTSSATSTQTALASPAIPPGAEPAVPANTPRRGAALAMGSRTMSDAALGFQPSTAPPLDASISQWVAAPVVARYRQTASNAGISAVSVAAVPRKGAASEGAVVANLDAVSVGPAGRIAALNGGVTPTAVVYFPGDGNALSAAARTQIRSAVAQYKAMGGTVRVVGHASSRTPNMSVEKHLELIFNKSQARANAVAQELIHQGVPADKVLVEAVGDSQPVYYESMPQGEAGNRRAEIYVQG